MTPFEQYAQSRNEQPSEVAFEVSLFNVWLVQSGNMPKTEREVEAMRKAWAAAWEQHNDLFFEALKPTIEEFHALRRLRDDLHETTNRYLERARKAEAEAAFNAEAWKRAEERISANFGLSAEKLTLLNLTSSVDRLKLLNDLELKPYPAAEIEAVAAEVNKTGREFLKNLSEMELKPTDSPALYLQQFGRVLRPGYKPPSRWQRFKLWVEDVREWLGDFPR